MRGADLCGLYLARGDSGAESQVAGSISRRLALPIQRVDLAPSEAAVSILSEVRKRVEAQRDERVVVLVVNAFLGLPTSEYPRGATWPAEMAALPSHLDFRPGRLPGPRCLLSLQIVWRIWAEKQLRIPILVTTGDLRVGPAARLALAEALGDGLACVLEDWRGRWRCYSGGLEWRASA